MGDNFAKILCRRTVEEEERKVILNLNRGRSLKKKSVCMWVCFVSFLNLKQPKHFSFAVDANGRYRSGCLDPVFIQSCTVFGKS